jgi:deazaflavin-dependent oxidoreductase (nitroreductase family)
MQKQQNQHSQIIKEFRTHNGNVGGRFEGAPLLLLTTTGKRTGKPRTTPLRYMSDGKRLIVFAANAGAPTHPDWYYNLLKHPHVTVEVKSQVFDARAIVITGEERERLMVQHVEEYPHFAEYSAKTSREIPVIALEQIEKREKDILGI